MTHEASHSQQGLTMSQTVKGKLEGTGIFKKVHLFLHISQISCDQLKTTEKIMKQELIPYYYHAYHLFSPDVLPVPDIEITTPFHPSTLYGHSKENR